MLKPTSDLDLVFALARIVKFRLENDLMSVYACKRIKALFSALASLFLYLTI